MTAAPLHRLRDLRRGMNLSQSNLGRRLGLSRRTVRAIESGEYAPSVTLACRIALVFGHPVEALFQP
jgi:putative transcriptional regulator